MQFNNKNIFCDFLTVSQIHKNRHNPFASGENRFQDFETGLETISFKWKSVDGYHFSNVQVRSNGEKIEFSGNISRYNRSENYFGLNLNECKKAINLLLLSLGLPPFTNGKIYQAQGKKNQSPMYDGAIISRLDMTANIATGSPSNRDAVLDHLQTIEHPTLDKLLWEKNTYFGKYSDSRTIRIYDKAKHLTDMVLPNTDQPEYISPLIQYINQNGIIRIETEYHRFLRTGSMRFWHVATHQKLCSYFKQDINLVTKKIKALDFDDIPTSSLGILMMYKSGINVKKRLAKNTFYKHCKILKAYGYDISNQNIHSLKPKTKTIILTVAEVPDFYKYPDKPWQLKST